MPRFCWAVSRSARQFHHSGGPARVIVGARMYRAGQVGGQRVLSAQSQVIVVRPDDYVLIGLPG